MAEMRRRRSDSRPGSAGDDRAQRPASNADAQIATNDTAVARRAYELYQSRGGEHGHDLDDWLQAESDVRRHRESKIRSGE